MRLAAAVLLIGAAVAEASPTIDDLSWMAGTWRFVEGEFGGHALDAQSTRLDEIWSAPGGGAMMGMFRWVGEDGLSLFELMTITAEESGLVFRLRHFSPTLVPWEDKDGALTYPLVRVDPDAAVFENPDRDSPRRFVFRREGDDRMVVRLEGITDQGEPETSFVAYKRTRSGAGTEPDPTAPSVNDRRVDYVELESTDVQESKRFYGAVFGWTFTDYGDDYASFEDGRLAGGFRKVEAHSGNGGALVVMFATDLEAVRDAVKQAGGTISQDIFSFPGGRRFHFQDPTGNELAVWSDK